MRGDDRQPDAMFSYVSAEQRVPRIIRSAPFARWSMRSCATCRASSTGCMRDGRPAVDSARAPAARAVAADLLLDSQRAAADGAARLQHPVSLVRRHGHGRAGLGADGLHEESRPAAESGHRPQLLPARRRARRGADVGRALHGRRHADRGVGESEEFSAERRRHRRRRARTSAARRARTTRTRRRPTRTRGCIASRTTPRRAWRIWATC